MITSVGKSLLERRRALGLCLDDVAHASRVARQNLRWLEADEFGHFPSLAYALAFVRFYGGVLGLDADALAAEARRQVALQQQLEKKRAPGWRRWSFFPFGADAQAPPPHGRHGRVQRLGNALCAVALSVILAAVGLMLMGWV